MTEAEIKKLEDEKRGIFTGGAAKIPETSNIEKKENGSSLDRKQENKKPEISEELRNRDVLTHLGMDDKEYEIKGNTISRKEKDYQVINGIKYPRYTDNKAVQIMKNYALEQRYEENKEKREKYLKNPKSALNQFGVDHVDNPLVRFGGSILKGKESVENLYMSKTDSYMDTDYAKKHKILNNYKEAPEELHEYLEKKITEQIGKGQLDTTKGEYIEPDSESSKSLSKELMKNEDFIKKLKDYETALKHNFSVNDSISFKKGNWHNALGNADILNMHINKNGDIEMFISDTYEFNRDEKSGLPAVGRDRQEKGEIIPHFKIYHVIIPKEYKDISLYY